MVRCEQLQPGYETEFKSQKAEVLANGDREPDDLRSAKARARRAICRMFRTLTLIFGLIAFSSNHQQDRFEFVTDESSTDKGLASEQCARYHNIQQVASLADIETDDGISVASEQCRSLVDPALPSNKPLVCAIERTRVIETC